MNWLFAIIVYLLLGSTPVHATVILNEISPRTDPEWVELYNAGDTAVDLTAWRLEDKAGNKEMLTTLATIPATSYLIFTRAKGWLNDTSEESLFLYDAANTLLDSVTYPSVKEGLTVARIPSVTGAWFTDQSPSLGFANPTPTPSPPASPSPSPLPSPLASPAISPSPVASPVVAATPTPSPSVVLISPSPVVQSSSVASPLQTVARVEPSGLVLAAAAVGTGSGDQPEIDLSLYGRSPSPATSGHESTVSTQPQLNQDRLRLVLSLGAGLICLALASYLGYRAYRKRVEQSVE